MLPSASAQIKGIIVGTRNDEGGRVLHLLGKAKKLTLQGMARLEGAYAKLLGVKYIS